MTSVTISTRHTPLISSACLLPAAWTSPPAPLNRSTWTTSVGGSHDWTRLTCLSWSVCYITDQLGSGDQVTLDDLSPSLLTNGTTPQSKEKAPNGQTNTACSAIDAGRPSEIPFTTFIQIYLIEAGHLHYKQLNRKSQMPTGKMCHPPVAPVPRRVATQWMRRPTASACWWILLLRRSRTRPTTHVRPLKNPDWWLTQYRRCWPTLTPALCFVFS